MKYFLALALILGSSVGMSLTATDAEAASISNPKCRAGLRETQSRNGYQAFAMTSGGVHCGWTIQASKSQSEANRVALHYCKSRANGARCRVVWPY